MGVNSYNQTWSFYDLFNGIFGRQSPGNDQQGFIFVQQSGRTNSGQNVNVDNLLSEPTTLTCINAITQGITQIPIQVRRANPDGTSDIVRGHAIERLMKKPNDYQTATEFKSSIVTSMLTHGNAFIKIVMAGSRPVQLYPLEPSDVTIGSDAMGRPAYHHETFGDLPRNEVIHVRDLVTFVPLGISRAIQAAELIGAKRAADYQMATTFKNGINMNYVVNIDGKLDADKFERLKDQLQNQFGQGGAGVGGAAVVEQGGITAIKGATPADMDLRELREQLIREIAAVFRVPEFLAGGPGDTTYNNVRQQWTAFHRDTLQPIATNIEEAFTLKLLGDNEFLHFDIAEILKGDIEITSRVANANVSNGTMTPNEARLYMGIQPHDSETADDLILPNSTVNTNVEPAELPQNATGGEDGPQGALNDPNRSETNAQQNGN